jgi:hypothetical protein
MSQLRIYLPDDIAQMAKSRAKAAGKSLSSYLADLIVQEVADDWPKGFFEEVAGGWKGEPLERTPGSAREDVKIAADFDGPLDDFAKYTR